jgi:Family of unknown function (DUF5670)
MLLSIAIILIILWVLGVFVARVASGLIHLIILLAVVVFVLHFVNARRGGAGVRSILRERHYHP